MMKGNIFRILTERRNVRGIRRILAAHGLDYTLFHAFGCFGGTPESSTIIELCLVTRAQAVAVAVAIGRANNQQCVMLQTVSGSAVLLDTGGTGKH
jgi:hypothetical protein